MVTPRNACRTSDMISVCATEYTVNRLCELQPASKMTQTEAPPKVVVIRNPHGAGEWTGSFGDGDMAWQVKYNRADAGLRELDGVTDDDGIFGKLPTLLDAPIWIEQCVV